MMEKDPTGRDQHAPGAKLDAGKQRTWLVLGEFAGALGSVADVGTYGANKYTPRGWLSVPDGIQRYQDALLRHLLADMRGEKVDKDTGCTHMAHAAWNALAIIELRERDRIAETYVESANG